MLDSGESQKEVIRPDFNRAIMIDFQGANITSDVGFLLMREIDDRFYVWGEEVKRSIDCLIKRLIKVGARVSYHARRWYVHVASAFPLARHYRAMLAWAP
jgi:hypothetical protein